MSENRKRNVQIKFRVTEEEAEQIRKKIEKSGGTIQDFMLTCIKKTNVTNTNGNKELLPELKRIGNNLNQIAKRCNEGGELARADEVEQIKKELEKVWQSLRQ